MTENEAMEKMEILYKEFPVTLVRMEDAMGQVIKCIGADTTKAVFAGESNDFKRGAMWGMAWVMMYANEHCDKYHARYVPEETYDA